MKRAALLIAVLMLAGLVSPLLVLTPSPVQATTTPTKTTPLVLSNATLAGGDTIAPHLYDWSFDGVDDYIDYGDVWFNTTYFVAEVKFNTPRINTYQRLFAKSSPGYTYEFLIYPFPGGYVRFYVYNGSYYVSPSNTIVENMWHVARLVFEDGNLTGELDDVSASTSGVPVPPDTTYSLGIGTTPDVKAYYYQGLVSYASIYYGGEYYFLSDPTFYNGTHYFDLASGAVGTPYGGVERVEASEKWLWLVKGLRGDGLVHLEWFPVGTRILFYNATSGELVLNHVVSSTNETVSLSPGNYDIYAYTPEWVIVEDSGKDRDVAMLGDNALVWFRVEWANGTVFTDSDGEVYINGTLATYDPTNQYWYAWFKSDTTATYNFTVSSIKINGSEVNWTSIADPVRIVWAGLEDWIYFDAWLKTDDLNGSNLVVWFPITTSNPIYEYIDGWKNFGVSDGVGNPLTFYAQKDIVTGNWLVFVKMPVVYTDQYVNIRLWFGNGTDAFDAYRNPESVFTYFYDPDIDGVPVDWTVNGAIVVESAPTAWYGSRLYLEGGTIVNITTLGGNMFYVLGESVFNSLNSNGVVRYLFSDGEEIRTYQYSTRAHYKIEHQPTGIVIYVESTDTSVLDLPLKTIYSAVLTPGDAYASSKAEWYNTVQDAQQADIAFQYPGYFGFAENASFWPDTSELDIVAGSDPAVDYGFYIYELGVATGDNGDVLIETVPRLGEPAKLTPLFSTPVVVSQPPYGGWDWLIPLGAALLTGALFEMKFGLPGVFIGLVVLAYYSNVAGLLPGWIAPSLAIAMFLYSLWRIGLFGGGEDEGL